jgi:hypothetical protein
MLRYRVGGQYRPRSPNPSGSHPNRPRELPLHLPLCLSPSRPRHYHVHCRSTRCHSRPAPAICSGTARRRKGQRHPARRRQGQQPPPWREPRHVRPACVCDEGGAMIIRPRGLQDLLTRFSPLLLQQFLCAPLRFGAVSNLLFRLGQLGFVCLNFAAQHGLRARYIHMPNQHALLQTSTKTFDACTRTHCVRVREALRKINELIYGPAVFLAGLGCQFLGQRDLV